MKTDNNLPAFPVPELGLHGNIGMSLRDYFAARAVDGILGQCSGPIPDGWPEAAADAAYRLADAMLAERTKVTDQDT